MEHPRRILHSYQEGDDFIQHVWNTKQIVFRKNFWKGTIPSLPDIFYISDSEPECRAVLKEILEDWVDISVDRGTEI